MTRTHHIGWTLDDEDETEITVEYTFSPGSPAFTPRGEYAPIDPPEGAEVEIVGATTLADPTTGLRQPVTLTDAEAEKVRDWIIERHEDDDDPDAAREHRDEQRQDDDMRRDDEPPED